MRKFRTLKKNRQFRRVYSKGRSVADKNIVLFVLENCLGSGRGEEPAENEIGISVSKKIGNSVTRNLVRRRLSEAYRALQANVKKGNQVVILARVPICAASYSEIAIGLKKLLQRRGLLFG